MSRSKSSRRAQQRKPNTWWPAALVIVLGLAAFGIWRAISATTPVGMAREISVAEAAARRDAGDFILDVREPNEWAEVHIPGATLIPLGQLAARVAELPGDQDIVVVCRSGNRSQEGRDILLEAGFERVTSMAGGMNEWQRAGFPTAAGP